MTVDKPRADKRLVARGPVAASMSIQHRGVNPEQHYHVNGTYQNFTLPHALIVATFAAVTAGAIWFRRRHPNGVGNRFDRWQAVVAVATWVAFTVWWMIPPRFDRNHSWPLHLCDMAGLVAPVALWTRWRWARTLLHYWGLGLSTQALVTPTLGGSSYDAGFWLFWGMHAAIVGPALYDVFARAYRPRLWPDASFAALVSVGYLLVVLPINLALHVNYGYVGLTKPDQPTLLDALGPWPQRLWLIIAGVATVYVVMTLPWELARRHKRSSTAAPHHADV